MSESTSSYQSIRLEPGEDGKLHLYIELPKSELYRIRSESPQIIEQINSRTDLDFNLKNTLLFVFSQFSQFTDEQIETGSITSYQEKEK